MRGLARLAALCLAGAVASAASYSPSSPPVAVSALDQQPLLLPFSGQHERPEHGSQQQRQPQLVHGQTSTLIDVLSASAEHSTLLRLLQRTKLIPALNALGNGTLFAPTNEAFARSALAGDVALMCEGGWEAEAEQDNLLLKTRGLLLYHLLNYSLPYEPVPSSWARSASNETDRPPPPPRSLFPPGQPRPLETLLYPTPPTDKLPSKPGPWLPTPKGQLGHEGQRVRGVWRAVAEKDGEQGGEDAAEGDDWIGVDGKGQGGVKVIGEPTLAGNGLVVFVDGVLEVPDDVGSTVLSHPSLSFLSSLLSPLGLPPPSPLPPSSYLSLLHAQPHLTLFAPSDAAWAALPLTERTYLSSGFAGEDIELLVGLHASQQDAVGWRERFEQTGGEGEVDVLGGGKVKVHVGKDGAMDVRRERERKKGKQEDDDDDNAGDGDHAASVVEADIYCANGAVHIVDSLLVPPFKVTPEKVLIGLNATRFVSLLREAELGAFVNGSSEGEAYTILAPVDLPPSAELLRMLGVYEGDDTDDAAAEAALFPPNHARVVEETLRYHILPGRLRPSDLQDGALLPSELRPPLLKNARQVVPVSVRRAVLGELGGNAIPLGKRPGRGDGGDGDGEGDEWAEVRFAGVEVVAEPIEVGRSIIYLLKTFLDPPRDVVEASVGSLELSTFLAASFSARLEDRLLRKAEGVTFFAPDNSAFHALGLVRDYILLPEARPQLRALLKHQVVDDVLYLADLHAGAPGKRRHVLTLEGGEIDVVSAAARGRNASLAVGARVIGDDGRKVNGELRDANVVRGDTITSNGVLHVVDQVTLPESLNITIANLLRGAGASVMADLLARADLGWVLNGTQPSEADLARLGIHDWLSEPADIDEASPVPVSFAVLAPSDEAFARVNISSYLSPNRTADLLDLLKLHILPSRTPIAIDGSPIAPVPLLQPSTKHHPSRPLVIAEDVGYRTLLSATSHFGDVAFREGAGGKAGNVVVGIKGARGIELHDWADVGRAGRASPRWERGQLPLGLWEGGEEDGGDGAGRCPGREAVNGVLHGGGVLLLDSVLEPFHPTWFMLHGTALLLSLAGGLLGAALLGAGGWWVWRRRRRLRGTDYEPVEEEED